MLQGYSWLSYEFHLTICRAELYRQNIIGAVGRIQRIGWAAGETGTRAGWEIPLLSKLGKKAWPRLLTMKNKNKMDEKERGNIVKGALRAKEIKELKVTEEFQEKTLLTYNKDLKKKKV